MIGRQLVTALARRPPNVPVYQRERLPYTIPATARPHPLRACACDVDLAVFGHTQCGLAGVPWPEDPQVRPPLI